MKSKDRIFSNYGDTFWAILWRAENKLDGKTEHLVHENCIPLLFRLKKDASVWIQKNCGLYKRPDLTSEPHGWKMPIPIKVNVNIKRVTK